MDSPSAPRKGRNDGYGTETLPGLGVILRISNYIWDAQDPQDLKGIWSGANQPTDFQKLGTAAYFFSAGCNIPLIVSGLG